MSWASAGVVKTAGSNPAGLSELVEFQGFGTNLRDSRWTPPCVVKFAGLNPAEQSGLVKSDGLGTGLECWRL